MMFLLDTNVLSESRKMGAGKADENVVAWLAARDAAACFVSAVTLMELDLGILLMERRDPVQGARLRTWMEKYVLPEFSDRIVPVDRSVALACARLHVPDPRPERDAFIAASALVHGMTLVTRNVQDFAPMGVALINPWEPI
ncbi:type II toxin-antitoxin system VapC family toxin [Shinella yambaruensis]|nr:MULTISPECIES: type II toxin-antitoxin system VapC family toxin [Shinella]MCJ8026434.1 type II toxin-antitoxin system VapC family toxin [Shinella yambaruensis]MCU7981841.1 type II toxin-antitoxin system VapC family toxin [Shinella yambaruensis]MCW5709646.1 type II toxin-antitoxin system VapC family toxin [Shinella sp.]